MSVLTLPACGVLSEGGNPAAETLSAIHNQYNGALAALEAYCSLVAPNDAEVAKICTPAMLTVHQTDGAIQAALGTITALLAKRAMSREGGMCTPMSTQDGAAH